MKGTVGAGGHEQSVAVLKRTMHIDDCFIGRRKSDDAGDDAAEPTEGRGYPNWYGDGRAVYLCIMTSSV
jgi:hypothetical protein